MFEKDKNLKDKSIERKPSNSYRSDAQKMSITMSYTKTQKLITALYMVTDIMDKDEPIRNKLRTLGLEIIAETFPMSKTVFDIGKIDQTMSFLNIASAMNFISEMNCSILKKEFLELKESIQELDVKPAWLEEFFLTPSPEETVSNVLGIAPQIYKGHVKFHNGQLKRTRIGVQKGSTLMKALSDKNLIDSLNGHFMSDKNSFNILKKQRRDSIINIIKNNGESSTIRDIKTKINIGVKGTPISEKTLQRELMSMIKDNVLNKIGEKRWSRYFIK